MATSWWSKGDRKSISRSRRFYRTVQRGSLRKGTTNVRPKLRGSSGLEIDSWRGPAVGVAHRSGWRDRRICLDQDDLAQSRGSGQQNDLTSFSCNDRVGNDRCFLAGRPCITCDQANYLAIVVGADGAWVPAGPAADCGLKYTGSCRSRNNCRRNPRSAGTCFWKHNTVMAQGTAGGWGP